MNEGTRKVGINENLRETTRAKVPRTGRPGETVKVGKRKKRVNPFYVLLVLAGIVFVVTACAYGVMMVQQLEPARALALQQQTEGLIPFMTRYGDRLLLIEVGILAVATVAAIGTDRFWSGDEPDAPTTSDYPPDSAESLSDIAGTPATDRPDDPAADNQLLRPESERGNTA